MKINGAGHRWFLVPDAVDHRFLEREMLTHGMLLGWSISRDGITGCYQIEVEGDLEFACAVATGLEPVLASFRDVWN